MTTPPPVQNKLFAAVDLETTGLDPKQNQIIEIGIQIFDSESLLDQFSMLINPGFNVDLPAHITELTGITSADLEDQPDIETVVIDVTKLLEGKIIVGHNVGFDLNFLSAAGFELNNRAFDTWELAYVLDFDSPDYSLETLLSRHFSVQDHLKEARHESSQRTGISTYRYPVHNCHRDVRVNPGKSDNSRK